MSEIGRRKMPGDEDFPLTFSQRHHFVPFENLQERLDMAHKDKEVRAQLRNGFTNPPAELFLVRGPNYLKEGHGGKNLTHLKVPSAEPLYDLIGVNMFRTSRRITKTAEEIGQLRRFFESQPIDKPDAEFPKFLIVNWMISPLFGWGKNHIVQHIFRLSDHPGHDSSIKAAFSRFKAGTDQERNHQLKYMFRVVEAPSAVKSAISYLGGERPVLIGKALTTHYHFGPNYLEINSDVSSSKIASAINGTILKNVETLVMDCSWLLEGQREEELPERLLCRIRWIWNCVEDVVVSLDDSGESSPK